jgi:hypothetical protein
MKRPRSIFKNVVAPIIGAMAILPLLVTAVRHVLAGRGAETYKNVDGLDIHYTSVLILIAALVFWVIVAYVARAIYFWREACVGKFDIRRIRASPLPTDSRDNNP